jgi:hypothetical protein
VVASAPVLTLRRKLGEQAREKHSEQEELADQPPRARGTAAEAEGEKERPREEEQPSIAVMICPLRGSTTASGTIRMSTGNDP